jgi:hypothetical protein
MFTFDRHFNVRPVCLLLTFLGQIAFRLYLRKIQFLMISLNYLPCADLYT